MKKISLKKTIPYPISLVKNVVLDVDAYKEFLPWAIDSKSTPINDKEFYGTLSVGHKGFSHSYKSHIRHDGDDNTYQVTALSNDKPFKELRNIWELKKVTDNSTHVDLNLTFAMEFSLAAAAFNLIFDKACQSMIQAFEERCASLSK
jgi:coenzyme Q-binding protein COQ10